MAKSIKLNKRKNFDFSIENKNVFLFQHRKRADDAVRRNKQLEKEADESRHRLSQATAELESAVQANRNYQSELVKVKSLNEQLTEQIDIITRDKRRLQGKIEHCR